MKPISTLIILLLLWGTTENLHAQTDSVTVLQSYERHWEMQPGLYRVLKNGLTGVVKANGQVVVPCQYDQVWSPGNNTYIRVLLNAKTGIYHLDKGMILPPEYDQIWDFENGLAKVMKNHRFGMVNTQGLMVIPCEYTHIWAKENNRFKVLKDGLLGYLAPDGTTIVPVNYQQIWNYQDNRARVLKNGKMGFIDESGNEVIPTIYDQASDFEDHKARVLINGQETIIDPKGHILNIIEDNANEMTVSHKPKSSHSDTLSTPKQSKPRIRIEKDYIEITHKATPTDHKKSYSHKRHFQTHLKGIGLASNGYLNSEGNDQLPVGYEFMSPVQNKSIEVSCYPWEESIALLGDWFGLSLGLGLQYNNYRFNLEGPDDIPEVAKDWFPDVSGDISYSKSKITTLYLNAPLLAEIQIKNRNNQQPLYLAGGIVGGIKLQSHTKLVYHDQEGRHKSKKRDNLGISMLRYGFMAKAGYGDISLYGTYYPSSLFDSNKGPELYPFSIGVMFYFD